MSKTRLQDLRFQGYSPRSMLDVGAHLGKFTREFLEIFPHCAPVLIEPNPHCRDALAALPYEFHSVAASDKAGEAELFLTKEWLQSTGTSLYREDTAFFRDDVVVKEVVQKVRLDDAFAGRRFDFVKIDTQGSELDVLRGGETILRAADYILIEVSLVEFNKGGAVAEAVFAQMEGMGFRCSSVTDFHRLRGVRDGDLLQMDFLFERIKVRPTQNFCYSVMHGHTGLLEYLGRQRARCSDFSVIDIGAAANPWSADVIDATFDMNDCAVASKHFKGNLNDIRDWDPVLRNVSKHGRFSFAICSHTLEDLAYPATTLEMLPRIAEAGYVSVPSRFLESLRPEGPYRGYIHHRWILDTDPTGERLVLAPKIALLEHLALKGEGDWPARTDQFEFQMMWRGAIDFTPINGDYLGPSRDRVINMYAEFMDRT